MIDALDCADLSGIRTMVVTRYTVGMTSTLTLYGPRLSLVILQQPFACELMIAAQSCISLYCIRLQTYQYPAAMAINRTCSNIVCSKVQDIFVYVPFQVFLGR